MDQRRWKSFVSQLANWTKRLRGCCHPPHLGARCRPYTVVLDMRSDQGCHRPDNEDSIRYVYPELPGRKADRGILALVADGMGGHAAGDVASAMAVRLIVRAYYRARSEPHNALKQAFREANRVIYRVAQQQADYRGMGTTCTGLVLRGGVAYAAHVGDSRLYLVRHGTIYLMTEDHSVAMHMMRQGLINPDEARRHRSRTVLLRALGTRSQVDVSTWPLPFPVKANDRFILCTDGLSDWVDEVQIKQIVMAYKPTAACERLIALAKRRGGYDNISVGVVWIKAATSTARSNDCCLAQAGRPTR